MTSPQYTITRESCTVILDGRTHTICKGERNFDAVRKAILDEEWDTVPALLVPGIAMAEWLCNGFTYDKGKHALSYKGDQVTEKLSKRILSMADEGRDPGFLLRFWEKLQQNPSWRSVAQLYNFLEHEGIPIDPNGDILAYKSVRRSYKDHHSNSVDNRPGAVPEMPRNKISDDPRVDCHEGFHVGALSYAQTFGSPDRRIIICKVNPRDVVCVPYDHSSQKMRVCRYEVLGNYGSQLPDTVIEDPEVEVTPQDPKVEVVATSPETPEVDTSEVVWGYLRDVSDEELEPHPLDHLRKYARHALKIVRASKIPGGKPVLLERIIDVRNGRDVAEDSEG